MTTRTVPEVEIAPLTFTPRESSRFGRLLTDALLFAGADAMRPALYGVSIEVLADGAVQMVATNSYVLAWIRDDEGSYTPSISWQPGEERPKPAPKRYVEGSFPATVFERDGLTEIAKALCKVKPGNSCASEVSITLDAQKMTVEHGNWTLTARAVDAQFPPSWRDLVPALDAPPEALPAPSLNVDHLSLLGKLTLGRRTRRGETFGLTYRTYGDKKPAAVIGSTEGVEFVGLIMPVTVKS